MPNLLQADVACNQGPCPTKVAGCMKQKSDQLCVPAPILRFWCRQWQQANPRTGTRTSLIVLVFKRGNNLVPQVCHSWNLKWLDCCQFHVFHVLHACHNLRREGSIQILIGVIFQATFVGLVLTATIDRARVCLFVCACVRVLCVTVRAKHSMANETLHRKHPNLARRPWAKKRSTTALFNTYRYGWICL